MKKEYSSLYVSIITVILFMFMGFACYNKINKEINKAKENVNVLVFNFDSGSQSLVINPSDMVSSKETPIAYNTITLTARYQNEFKKNKTITLLMDTLSDYLKSDGANSSDYKEYTYEIKKDGQVLIPETQFDSYKKESEIILMKDKITSSPLAYEYKIIFRFYSNGLDQTHLIGDNLSSMLKVK